MNPVYPETRSFLWLTENELNRIATEFYGRKYVAQQTGDMLPNDSFHVFEMSEEDVADWTHDMEQERSNGGHYVGLKRVARGMGDRVNNDHIAVYAEGMNWFDYWLSLRHDPDNPDNHNNPESGVSYAGQSFQLDFQVYREAPTPSYVLADLIKNKILPYGTYLVKVSW